MSDCLQLYWLPVFNLPEHKSAPRNLLKRCKIAHSFVSSSSFTWRPALRPPPSALVGQTRLGSLINQRYLNVCIWTGEHTQPGDTDTGHAHTYVINMGAIYQGPGPLNPWMVRRSSSMQCVWSSQIRIKLWASFSVHLIFFPRFLLKYFMVVCRARWAWVWWKRFKLNRFFRRRQVANEMGCDVISQGN